ncbi:MAG: hypothetical protein U1D55_06975 [Phycisphaerae bacterium]
MEDTIELVSLNQYDGGAWEIEVYTQGNLARSGGESSSGGNGLPPWFDVKSGKIRR